MRQKDNTGNIFKQPACPASVDVGWHQSVRIAGLFKSMWISWRWRVDAASNFLQLFISMSSDGIRGLEWGAGGVNTRRDGGLSDGGGRVVLDAGEGKRLLLFSILCMPLYTYHSFFEITEPSVWETISSAISGSGSYLKARVRSS